MTDPVLDPSERVQSQLTAVQMLAALGFQPISPRDALAMRGGKRSNVLLDEVLEEQLIALNRVHHRGREYPLDITDAREAIRRLRLPGAKSGLRAINQKVYDDLVRGIAVPKTIDGVPTSPHVRFVDWTSPANNVYHVTTEYAVERTGSTDAERLDVVAFVNGIPFIAIECKRAAEPITNANRQLLRYQRPQDIPGFFHFAQLLLGVNQQTARYATVQTPSKFWTTWRHPEDEPDAQSEQSGLLSAVHASLPEEVAALFGSGAIDDNLGLESRTPSEQDAAIYALCRPERLLELVRTFTVFDGGVRKVARHQQFFAVKRTLEHVTSGHIGQQRPGGLIWHTQGSGKSLTMVMLAKALTYEPSIADARVVLVTDRDDLDLQIRDTFQSCGLEPIRARSGKHLAELIRDRVALVTTIVNKFENAAKVLEQHPIKPDPDVFVLVDEGHRGHSARVGDFAQFAGKMRRALPQANYIAFTGTPLMTKQRSSFHTFGDLIHRYTIKDANDDGAVVPLLYEGRYVEKQISDGVIDAWFERLCEPLSSEQRRDLKKKFSREKSIAGAEQVIRAKAFDISEHYRRHWQGTGLKAQLVAPDKASAIRFKQVLDEIGDVSSEVMISAPGDETDVEAGDRESKELVRHFWDDAMKRYGNEPGYNKAVIEAFRDTAGQPEILIVVSKLLTGFDAPRNTVLYLCRPLRDHTLLQAIARVNRLYEPSDPDEPKKEFGFVVDYEGLLEELDHALEKYSALEGFDPDDVAQAVISVREEIEKLNARWAAVRAVFEGSAEMTDQEGQAQLLEALDLRQEFYGRLSAFTSTLHIALSSDKIDDLVPRERLERYKSDWKWFVELRRNVQHRYNEIVDLRDYEPKIQRLLDQHLTALPAEEHIAVLDLSDPGAVHAAASDVGRTPAARADRIASAMKKRISDRYDEDPALYERFSSMLQQTIEEHRAHRLEELAYLERILSLSEDVMTGRRGDGLPASIRADANAASVFEVILGQFAHAGPGGESAAEEQVAVIAKHLIDLVEGHHIVGIWQNENARNEMLTEIDMYLWNEVEAVMGLALSPEEEDAIRSEVERIGRARFP